MIYNASNTGAFMQNYMSADGSGDMGMKRDILMSEIAKIIVGKPQKVMGHLKLYGFAIRQSANKTELAEAVSRALYKSPRFARAMAIEILGGNYGAAGSTETTQVEPTSTTTSGGITMSPTTSTTAPAPTTTSAGSTVSGPVINPTVSAPTTTSTASPTPNPAPVVAGLGQVFGGTTPVMSGTSSSPYNPPPVYVINTGGGTGTTSGGSGGGLMDRIFGDGGGSGGGGGGGGSANDAATEELKDKVNAMGGKVAWSVKKKIAVGMFWGLILAGTYYGYNKYKGSKA